MPDGSGHLMIALQRTDVVPCSLISYSGLRCLCRVVDPRMPQLTHQVLEYQTEHFSFNLRFRRKS